MQPGSFPLLALVAQAGASFVYAAGETVIGNIAASYRSALIPDALQGRVNSVYRLAAFGGPPLGLVLAGLLLQIGGLALVVFVFAPALIVLALLYTLSPHVRRASLADATQ